MAIKFSKNFYLTVFGVYQFFSTLAIAIGIWPAKLVFLNLAIQLLAIIFFDLEYALHSIILSIPFYLALPMARYDTVSTWRIAVAFLFAVFLWKWRKAGKRIELFSWDKPLFWLVLAIILSIVFEPFKAIGIKKLLFVVNIYFLYVVAFNVLRDKEKVVRTLVSAFASTAAIVLLGFAQLFALIGRSYFYFWQYWATVISPKFYGMQLANSQVYSNSWFSFYWNKYGGQKPSLRLFSVLPDSHAYAAVAMFSLPFAAALIYFAEKRWQKVLLFIYLIVANLGIVLSGTRGVWLGIALPTIVLTILYAKHYGRPKLKLLLAETALFAFVFLGAQAFQSVYHHFRPTNNSISISEKIQSIYDVSEQSNNVRLKIWQNTLKFWTQHPLLGSGYGNFLVSLQREDITNDANYQQLSTKNFKAVNLPTKYVTAHSLYLDFLAETGIIGLFVFLFYLWKLFKQFWQHFKEHYLFNDGLNFFVFASAFIMLWLFAYSLIDGTLINDRVLMYYFIDLAICGRIITM